MTPAGIEPATFRFVAQHLNHCATAVSYLVSTAVKEAWPPVSLCTTEQVFTFFRIIHRGIEVGSPAGGSVDWCARKRFLKKLLFNWRFNSIFLPLFSHFLSLEEACAVENPTVAVFSQGAVSNWQQHIRFHSVCIATLKTREIAS